MVATQRTKTAKCGVFGAALLSVANSIDLNSTCLRRGMARSIEYVYNPKRLLLPARPEKSIWFC